MESLKIGMLAPEFLPVWGGVGTHILELVSHLPEDIEVTVVTVKRPVPGTHTYLSRDEILSQVARPIELVELVVAKDTFIYNAKLQIACLLSLKKLVKEFGIELIHTHFPHMPDLLCRYTRMPVKNVVTVHTTLEGQAKAAMASGLSSSEMDRSEKMTLRLYPILKYIERGYLARADNVITVSNWLAEGLKNQYGMGGMGDERDDWGNNRRKILEVIPNGVDVTRFQAKPPSEEIKSLFDTPYPVVLFTGRLVSAKGIQYLVDAIPSVLKKLDAYFVFVGGGNPAPYISRLSNRKVSDKNYRFLGYLPTREDMVSAYNLSDVYVAPTLYENLPIRVLEAMSCERAVLATDVCAIPEAITHGVNGYLIPPADSDAISTALIELLSDSSLRRRLGKNARKTVLDRYNWEDIAKKTVTCYEQILER